MTITFSAIVYQQLRLDGFVASAALFYAFKVKTAELMNFR